MCTDRMRWLDGFEFESEFCYLMGFSCLLISDDLDCVDYFIGLTLAMK
jgi:hypothetical protein